MLVQTGTEQKAQIMLVRFQIGLFLLLLLSSKIDFFKIWKALKENNIDPVTWKEFGAFEYKWNWKVDMLCCITVSIILYSVKKSQLTGFQKFSVFFFNFNRVSRFHCSSYERTPCIWRESTFEPGSSGLKKSKL